MELQFDVSEENKKQEDVVLAPSEPNIEIRTMKSDIQALKESGGDLINIPAAENTAPAAPQPAIPDQAIFTGNQDVSDVGGNNSSVAKMIIIIIAVLVLAACIGFASYYLASRVL